MATGGKWWKGRKNYDKQNVHGLCTVALHWSQSVSYNENFQRETSQIKKKMRKIKEKIEKNFHLDVKKNLQDEEEINEQDQTKQTIQMRTDQSELLQENYFSFLL